MSGLLRLAGAGMVLGSVLFFARMGPIFAILPEGMAFPPETAADLVRLADLAGPRWQLSHAMGLVAVWLFIFGYWAHARALSDAGHKTIGAAAAIIATLAFGGFTVALMIDGFALPATISTYLASPGADGLDMAETTHNRALMFFTPAIFFMFVAMGVLSSRMLHGFIHSRWLGGLGMLIAIAATAAYLFGLTGANWDNLRIGGSFMMAGFVWHLFIGIAALFGRGIRT